MLSRPLFFIANLSVLSEIRAVLSRGGGAVDLTEDHKPDAPRELERIFRYTDVLLCTTKNVACFTR